MCNCMGISPFHAPMKRRDQCSLYTLFLLDYLSETQVIVATCLQGGLDINFLGGTIFMSPPPQNWAINVYSRDMSTMYPVDMKKKRSTEGCSTFKGPETRQVQERLVSTLEHTQVPKWDRTRCPEE